MKRILATALTACICFALLLPLATAQAAEHSTTALSFRPADVVSNADNSVIYLSDKTGKKIYSLNTVTFEQKTLSFDLMPESMYFKDGNLYVSLCTQAHSSYWWTEDQYGAVAVVDCTTFTKTAQYTINIDPYDIVVSTDNNIYVASGSGQWTNIIALNTSGTLLSQKSIRQASTIAYNPVLNRVYSITSDSSPRNMTAFSLNNTGAFADTYGWRYHGDYSMGTTFQVAPDGMHILNSSGNIFTCSADSADDMKFKTSLNRSWVALAFNEDGTKFYTALNNGQIYAYDYAAFAGTATYMAQGYPQYMFAKDNALIAVSKATPDGGQYFVETIDLSVATTVIEQMTVETSALLYEGGHALLGIKSNAKTVFNGDMMYIADHLGSAVFAVDTTALTETKITFPDAPDSLYYDRGELFIGFGSKGVVVILDAETLEIKDKLFLGTVFYDLAVGKDGFLYIIENFGSSAFSYARSYSRTTGQQLSSASVYPRNGKFVPHPLYNMLYWADTGVSPQDISALAYAEGVITTNYDSPYHGDYPIGSRIKISPDGAYIFSNSGSVFTSSSVASNDMQYKDKFLSFADLIFDLPNQQMYASGIGPHLYVYDYSTYEANGFIRTILPVKEMSLYDGTIIALSAENNNRFYLELLSPSDILQVAPELIRINYDDVIFLDSARSIRLAPTLLYNDGTSKSITTTAAYHSSDESVAVISASGVLLANAPGHAVITIASEGIIKSIDVYVDFDVSAISVEGYDLGFSPFQTTYLVILPSGATEPPVVTYDAPEWVLVEVTSAVGIPGTTTLVVTDADARFSKTYTIHFVTESAPPVGDSELPFIISGYWGAGDGFIYIDLMVEKNPEYLGSAPSEYTVVIQLFTKDLEPVSMSAIPNLEQMHYAFSDQYIATIAIVDQFGMSSYIGVPLAKPVTILL